jgi:hypothetical protein
VTKKKVSVDATTGKETVLEEKTHAVKNESPEVEPPDAKKDEKKSDKKDEKKSDKKDEKKTGAGAFKKEPTKKEEKK